MDIPKEKYIGIVKHTLKSMADLSMKDKSYCLYDDIISYYNNTIEPEGVLTNKEFTGICREVAAELTKAAN